MQALSAIPLAPWIGACQPLELPDVALAAAMPTGSPSSTSTQDNCLSTLPRQTRVRIVGNQRTKRSLLGLECIVKRATGLGGWHWLILPNGEEIKLQRNALSVIELGPEQTEESSEEEDEPDAREAMQIEILDRPRIRRPPRALSPVAEAYKASSRPSSSGSGGSAGGSMGRYHPYTPSPVESRSINLMQLDTDSLRRYRRVHQLGDVEGSAPKEALIDSVSRHFKSQMVVDEGGVLLAFCAALRRRSSSGSA
ncbi:hypothetical protein Rsub_03143 [Raphidocelis subcapitata]|uniref:Histone deacetylase complex subunit SAP30 Sin3 binding domain-containing protein n=1 Tax=Raphidocelis subcapitata TaxID=307507 RepID=A0A2V0NSF7_9CHLO|nr:hypothetical protein Rsub_03143 [Raphidocelis subcapitata]|eukprot:GBF90571.1 hypothetical protein Rsub_03143 [Raphidocelis subcapitata]